MHDPSHEYADECPGCRPCIFNGRTGEVLPDNHPVVRAARRAFYEGCSLAERRGYHRAMFQGSGSADDLRARDLVVGRLLAAVDAERAGRAGRAGAEGGGG